MVQAFAPSTLASEHAQLYEAAVAIRAARGEHHHIGAWYGKRNGSNRRTYVCYLCDCIIDTESAQSRPTVHAYRALDDHARWHLDETTIGEHGEQASNG